VAGERRKFPPLSSNPPFSKTNLAGVISQYTFGGNDGFKKIKNLEFLK
jgi:hypothetical protein